MRIEDPELYLKFTAGPKVKWNLFSLPEAMKQWPHRLGEAFGNPSDLGARAASDDIMRLDFTVQEAHDVTENCKEGGNAKAAIKFDVVFRTGVPCFMKIFAIEFDASLIGKLDSGPDGIPGLCWSYALYKHCWDIGDKTPGDRISDAIKKVMDKAQEPIHKAFDLLNDVVGRILSGKPKRVDGDDLCGPYGNPDRPWRDDDTYTYHLHERTTWLPIDSNYHMLITDGVQDGTRPASCVGHQRMAFHSLEDAYIAATPYDRSSVEGDDTDSTSVPMEDYDTGWKPP